jgi:hypothetical protein
MAVSGRYVYCLPANANPADFDPRDGAGGYVPVIYYRQSLFERDGTDTTTPASAVCLVTIDGSRYKITDYDLLMGYSIVAADVTTPPDPDDVDESLRPVEGQAWRVPAGGTGDWSDKEDFIAVWTARSWAYVAPKIGRLVFNEATGGYEHIDVDGDWVNGVGSNPIANGVLVPNMVVGGGSRFNWVVENQTTNAPPDPIDGVSYIVGPSPTGRWTGHSGKIATGENGGETLYTPAEGWLAYDKAQDGPFRHSGSVWLSSFGNFSVTRRAYTSSTTWTKPARLFMARVWVVGGGGGGVTGSGGSSSFGSHCSASGGAASGGAPGSGSGGDINLTGERGFAFTDGSDACARGGAAPGPYGGVGSWCRGASLSLGQSYGGAGAYPQVPGGGSGGGFSTKVIPGVSLGSNVAVTVGAGASDSFGGHGAAGIVVVEEYTFA